MEAKERLTGIISDFIATVAIRLPDDVEKRIKELAAEETEGLGKDMYGCILENIELAKKLNRPLCQDTGVLQFFVKVGTKNPCLDIIESAIIEGTAQSTKRTPLRPNVVEPLGEHNTGNNVGYHAPYIESGNSSPEATNFLFRYIWRAAAVRYPAEVRFSCRSKGWKALRSSFIKPYWIGA